MIEIDPTNRPTFDTLLHNARGTVFPETFYSFLHNYVASINELSSSSVFTFGPQAGPTPATSAVSTPINTKATNTTTGIGMSGDIFQEPLPSDSDHRMERVWSDYESVEPYLLHESESEALEETIKEPVKVEYASAGEPGKPFQVCLSISRSSRMLTRRHRMSFLLSWRSPIAIASS